MGDLVAAALFVPLMIIAVTQMIKMAAPEVNGWVTIGVAFAVGILVAIVDGFIGVTNINIAQGIVFALEAIGITVAFGKAGGGARGDESRG